MKRRGASPNSASSARPRIVDNAIALQRLTNQHLAARELSDPRAIVRRLGAVQAQDYAGGKWGIGLRGIGVTDRVVERALDEGSLLRTHVLRPTWHIVAAEDLRWMLALTGPRVLAANASMCKRLELDGKTLARCMRVIEKALAGQHLTREELAVALQRAKIDVSNRQRLAYVVMHGELTGVIASGRRRGKQSTYALLGERVAATRQRSRDGMLAELARRYFETRGPATVHDFSWWSGLTLADSKHAIALLGDTLSHETVNHATYWFSGAYPPAEWQGIEAHLLPNYDEYFIGFRDRGAMLGVVKEISLLPGHPMFATHLITLRGQVVGGWTRTLSGRSARIALTLAMRPTAAQRQAILAATERYADFLEMPVEVTLEG